MTKTNKVEAPFWGGRTWTEYVNDKTEEIIEFIKNRIKEVKLGKSLVKWRM